MNTHTYRKTVAILLDRSGASARMIADQLGHSRISMTQDVYLGRRAANAGNGPQEARDRGGRGARRRHPALSDSALGSLPLGPLELAGLMVPADQVASYVALVPPAVAASRCDGCATGVVSCRSDRVLASLGLLARQTARPQCNSQTRDEPPSGPVRQRT